MQTSSVHFHSVIAHFNQMLGVLNCPDTCKFQTISAAHITRLEENDSWVYYPWGNVVIATQDIVKNNKNNSALMKT